jgi:nucleotide-binding universal stress UspA family protein
MSTVGYRNVVVGTDGSETAARAVEHAAMLASAFGARLTVVTAYTPGEGVDPQELEKVPEDVRWRLVDAGGAEDLAGHAKELAKAAGVTDVRTRVAAGDPAAALIDAAEDTLADVIVVGSVGMTGASRFVLGSVPNKVSHHAPCDVLIVHTT